MFPWSLHIDRRSFLIGHDRRAVADPAVDRLDRETCAAGTSAVFRAINERVKDLNSGFSVVLPVGEWICECANDTCIERIQMSAEEYAAVRQEAACFVVAPSHEHVLAASQRIVERHERYWVVKRIGEPREFAEPADPRAQDGARRHVLG
jgi:hypothetical protein